MGKIDINQLLYLLIILAGVLITWEIVRILIIRSMGVSDSEEGEQKVASVQRFFGVVRLLVVVLFLVFIVFTLLFNRGASNEERQDMGHESNVEKVLEIDEDALKKSIEEREEKLKEKSIEEINKESKESYDQFIEEKKNEGN